MALTNTAVNKAKPKEKDYKLSNEKGLFFIGKKNGGQVLAI